MIKWILSGENESNEFCVVSPQAFWLFALPSILMDRIILASFCFQMYLSKTYWPFNISVLKLCTWKNPKKLATAMKLQSESLGYCVEHFLWALIVDVTTKSFK